MKTKLIGLTGKARSGKDTVALMLASRHNFMRMAFADPLKEGVAAMFNWPVELTHTQEGKEMLSPTWGITVRQALQDVGTLMREKFGADFWIKRWQLEYAAIMNDAHVVVSDVRYENEAEMIRAMGGTIIHIQREGAGLEGAAASHSSESGIQMDDKDLVLHNNGTLKELEITVGGTLRFMDMKAEGVAQ
jgi:hypothetical protein